MELIKEALFIFAAIAFRATVAIIFIFGTYYNPPLIIFCWFFGILLAMIIKEFISNHIKNKKGKAKDFTFIRDYVLYKGEQSRPIENYLKEEVNIQTKFRLYLELDRKGNLCHKTKKTN